MRTCRSTTPHPAAIGVTMPCTRTSGHKDRHAFRHYGVALHTWKHRTGVKGKK